MPFIRVLTSQTLTAAAQQALREAVLDAVSLLHKPRAHAMALIADAQALARGDGDAPCAFCEAQVFGAPEPADCDRFAQALSAAIARIAQVAPENVYLSVGALPRCYTGGCLPPGH